MQDATHDVGRAVVMFGLLGSARMVFQVVSMRFRSCLTENTLLQLTHTPSPCGHFRSSKEYSSGGVYGCDSDFSYALIIQLRNETVINPRDF